jgi:hypothetical protein
VDHLEQEQDDDSSSSTENLRHGYLPTQHDDVIEQEESINTMMKKLNVVTSTVWEGTYS